MRQTRQGGSSIIFILIGVLLAALLIGGVYALRQQTAQKPIAVKPQSQGDRGASEAPKEDNKKEAPSNDETSLAQNDSSRDQNSAQTSQESTNATELPRTGGSENIGILMSTALLTGTFVAYVNSRRAARLSF